MTKLTRRTLLLGGIGAGAYILAGNEGSTDGGWIGGGGGVVDYLVFHIAAGERLSIDDGSYHAIRWETDAALNLANGDAATFTTES